MSSESKAPETIVFNVGGRTFKVSRSLIEHYSETMLGRLISDEWQANSNDEPIFVDRNGDLFAFVLDYLRYGSVELPHNVPRSNFLRELDFYGVCVIDEADIKQDSSVEALQRLKQNVAEAEMNHDMFLIAVHAYHQFMTGNAAFFMYDADKDDIGLKRNPSEYATEYFSASNALQSYLKDYYGLQAGIGFDDNSIKVKVSKQGFKEKGIGAKKDKGTEKWTPPILKRQYQKQNAISGDDDYFHIDIDDESDVSLRNRFSK